ncbi:hypothetical protein BH20ACT14_BH20ACT14_14250 [soil metagenome]
MATLAFFLAVSGATAVGASALLTGRDIRDGTITGADVRNHSLPAAKLKRSSVTGALVRDQSVTGSDLKDGSLRAVDFDAQDLELLRGPRGEAGPKGDQCAQGTQGPAGEPGSAGIERISFTGSDVNGYVNGSALIDRQVPTQGGWLMLARAEVTNSGVTDESFNCGLVVGGQTIGGGGDFIPVGTTKEIVSVAFGPVDANEQVLLGCDGGAGTFDVANVSISLARLM